MALVPQSTVALIALAVSLGGLVYVTLRRDMPKAYGLAFLIFVVFGIQTAAFFFMGGDPLPQSLGFRAAPFLAGEQWWAPLTYLFVHAGVAHLAGNMLLLVSAGPLLEDRLGGARFMLVYLVAGFAAVGAHLVFVYWIPLVPAFIPAVGASGALFGVLTVLAFHWPRERIPVPILFIIWMPSFLALMIFLVMNLALMFSTTSVAWYGHFAGFLAGLVLAPFLVRTAEKQPRRGLPDLDALAPLATTPRLQESLERLRSLEGQTEHDLVYADAWLDRFFQRARCPEGHELERRGLRARCAGGEFEVEFAR